MAISRKQKQQKKFSKKKPGQRKGMRSQATDVLAQGVGAVPKKAFGGARTSASLACWDAKLLHHLPLPRAVGPYTVVRTTKRFSTDAAQVILGTFKEAYGTAAGSGDWSNVCAMLPVQSAAPVNRDPANGIPVASPLTFLGNNTSMATCTPAAFTVQILNPEPLQTTNGIIYAGVMNTQAKVADRGSTWAELFDLFVQYQSPRLMSAAKLALRGVQISSYPLSMSQISEFTGLVSYGGEPIVVDNTAPMPTGWAPIMVSNPQQVLLEFLVTTEWRVRFDLMNPASAGHTHHPVASDHTWDVLCQRASALGHGVRDIAEVIANGAEVYKAVRTAGAAVAAMAA